MKASVIISVYKNTDALRAVLDSLAVQSEKDFEIIISEDGQSQEMSRFVHTYSFKNPYLHLTQPDEGWRKNRALNRAIMAAKSAWLIFIDGDCVLHPRFIEHHLLLSSPKAIVAGKRVKLNRSLSTLLQNNPKDYMSVTRVLRQCLWGSKSGNGFIEEGFFISRHSLLGFIPALRRMYQLKGCNMSFSKAAILEINGFDEDYIRPAIGEDIDLTWRFIAAGYHLVSARNLAVQYHLYHKENWTDQGENIRIMEEKQKRNEYICRNGINKL